MVEKLVIANVSLPIIACALAWIVEHFLDLYEAQLYYAGARDYVEMPGRYELAAEAVEDFAARRYVSFQLVGRLAALCAGLAAAWWFFTQHYQFPEAFLFLVGGLLLMDLYACMQHARHIALFRIALGGSLQGSVAYTRQAVLDLGVVDLYSFVGLFVLVFVLYGSWFFLGGALTCLITARRRRDLAVMVEHMSRPRIR